MCHASPSDKISRKLLDLQLVPLSFIAAGDDAEHCLAQLIYRRARGFQMSPPNATHQQCGAIPGIVPLMPLMPPA